MNSTVSAFAFVVIASICSPAQTDEVKRAEFFAGYSFGSAGADFGPGGAAAPRVYQDRVSQHGFNASGVVNLSRYVGIKGDVSGTYKKGRLAFQVPSGSQNNPTATFAFDAKTSLYNFLGGVQIKDNSTSKRVKPFAHAMIGAAHRSNKIQGGGFTCILIIPCPRSTSETGFAGAFGGGLDVRLGKGVALRAFQVDYNPIKFDAGTDHNFRFSTGLVF
ncbi:MAG: outer membrane beta-barrel protein [Pyrinomonadaceae bacterium]